MCCHVLLPAHVFLSGLGNTPVTEIGGSPFPHGGAILNVGRGSCSGAINNPTACVDAVVPAFAHWPVPMYQLHQGRTPHIGLMGGMLLTSSFSGWICQKLIMILNQKNCMVSLGNWHSFVLLLQDNELLLEAWKLGFKLCNFRVSLC